MRSVLIEHEDIARAQKDGLAVVDDMRCCSAAHIDHLDIIMAVSGKMYKAGVRTDLDQLVFIEELSAVHDKGFLGGIEFFLYARVSVEDRLLFSGDLLQFIQQICVHAMPSKSNFG